MNELLEAQTKLWEKLAGSMSQAMNVSQSLKSATEGASEAQKKSAETTQNLNDIIKENTDGTDGLTDALGRNQKAMSINTNKLDKYAKVAIGAKVATDAFNSGINFLSGSWDLLTSGVSGAIGLFSSGMKVVTGFFSGLFSAAADYRNKTAGEMFAANQDIIKQFGNLDETQGKFVKSMSKELGPASAALGKAGNSLWAAIGNGAAVLKEMTALAGDFGDSLVFLQDQVGGAVSELLIMKKGMNLSADAMKNLGSIANSTGGSLQDSLTEGMVASAYLSKQFGVDVKIIGKNLSALASDMETFGHLSTKEMAAVATYSAKLGVEIGALKGVMDKFDSFEGAAQSAGKLAEAFGMNIDAMAMMNAENPAERIDMLRQSLADTGKSFDELSRHEKKLMAETMGMDMSSLQNAMSIDPDEMGFDDFGDAAEEAAEKMTPEQAMADVAKSIEKMAHAMTNMTDGPFSEFIRGFMQVLERSPEWKELMKLIGSWLKEFFEMGKAVGELFLGFLRGPGKGVLEQLKNIFNLDRIRKFKDDVVGAFSKFFDLLDADPQAAIEGLFDDIMAAITDWSTGTGEGATGISDMFMNMIEGGIRILGGLIPKIMTTVAGWLVNLTEAIRDWFDGDKKGQDNMTDGIGGALSQAMSNIGAAWSDKLWPALSDLFSLLLEKAAPYIIGYLALGFTFIFMKAIGTAMIQLAAMSIAKKIGAGLGKMLGGKDGALEEAQKSLPKEAKPGSGEQKSMFQGLKDMFDELGKIKYKDVLYAGAIIVTLSVFVGVSLVVFATAIKAAAAVLSNTSWSDFGKAIIASMTGIIGTIALVAATKLLPDKSEFADAMINMGLAVVFFSVSVIAFSLAIAAAAAIMSFVKWNELGKVFVGTTLGIIGTIALALTAMSLDPAIMGPAMKNLALAAVFFTVGVVVFSAAIWVAAKIMEGVGWNELGKVMVGTTFGIIGTVAIAFAAVGLGALLNGPQGAFAIGGLVAGAVFFTAGVVVFSLAIAAAALVMEGVSWDSMEKVFVGLGGALLGTLAIAGIGALLGSPAGLIAMGFATMGIPAGAALLTGGVVLFGAAMVAILEAFNGVDLKRANFIMDMVWKSLEMTMGLVPIGNQFAALNFWGSLEPVEKGIEALANVGANAFKQFANVIEVVNGLPIDDPESFKLKMDAIGQMMTSTQALAQLGLDAMAMATVASTFSDSGPEEMMNQMSSFVTGTIDSVKNLIDKFVTMAMGMDDSALKGAESIAKIIAVVAELGAKLMGPMTEIISMNDDNWYTDNSANQIGAMASGIAQIMTTLQTSLPGIVQGILDATATITNPDEFLKKAQGMEAAFKGLVAIIGAVSKLYADAEAAGKGKGAKGWFTDGDVGADSMLGQMFDAVVSLFGPMGGLRRMVRATVSLLNDPKMVFPEKAVADNFKAGMDSMMKVIKDVIAFATSWDEKKQTALNSLGKTMTDWASDASTSPADIVRGIVKEATEIATAVGEMKINLDKLPLKVLSDGVLGNAGERKFTIEPKGVNIQVNFSVEMNAEQLATQIYKGNKKNGKEGFFTLHPNVNAAELDKNP